jgi:hypothetical protein
MEMRRVESPMTTNSDSWKAGGWIGNARRPSEFYHGWATRGVEPDVEERGSNDRCTVPGIDLDWLGEVRRCYSTPLNADSLGREDRR